MGLSKSLYSRVFRYSTKGIQVLLTFLLAAAAAKAQVSTHHGLPHLEGKTSLALADGSPAERGNSGTGENINVIYHKTYWRVNPDSAVKYIRGNVQTNFITREDNVTKLSFDLHDTLVVDSIIFRNTKLPSASFTRSNHIITIALGTTLAKNTTDSIRIFYQGTPPRPINGLSGFGLATNQITGQKYITSLSESYEDRNWWPCKADMQDKVDSMDMTISVPWSGADTFWVASNGILTDSSIAGNSRLFTYKTRYPMASYLACICVARFNRYYTQTDVNGTSVPVAYYLQRGRTDAEYTNILVAMNKINLVLSAFSSKYGDYGFKKEKHGFYDGVSAGGMEHQTFSGMGSNSLSSPSVLAHELGHQWFGDKVTCGTWNDLWLSEGFATFSEVLAAETVPSLGLNPLSIRTRIKADAQSYLTTSAWIPDVNIASSNTIWFSDYGGTVYDRGGASVIALRTLLGDDMFFQLLRNYQTSPTLEYQDASFDTMVNYASAISGRDLLSFFNDHIKGTGHPTYEIAWNNPMDNGLVIKLVSQTMTDNSNIGYFHSPIALRVQGAGGRDTTIVIYDENGALSYAGKGIGQPYAGNIITYTLGFKPTIVTFDPFALTIANGTVTKDESLPLYNLGFTASKASTANDIRLTLNETSRQVILERSADGSHFTTIGNMSLQHNGAIKQYYFKDANPLNTSNYYRAKYSQQTAFGYSKIVRVDNNKTVQFAIVNNPVINGMLVLKTNAGGTFKYFLYDAAGKKLQGGQRFVQGGNLVFDVHSFTAGVYLLQIAEDDKTETMKFVVK